MENKSVFKVNGEVSNKVDDERKIRVRDLALIKNGNNVRLGWAGNSVFHALMFNSKDSGTIEFIYEFDETFGKGSNAFVAKNDETNYWFNDGKKELAVFAKLKKLQSEGVRLDATMKFKHVRKIGGRVADISDLAIGKAKIEAGEKRREEIIARGGNMIDDR